MTTLAPPTGEQVYSGGTVWRLRSLVAMGHDTRRIAGALRVHPEAVKKILRGEAETVSASLRDLTCQLWDAWWDKRPPERTHSERARARAARSRAEHEGWCPPLGLAEDELDEPGYRPYSRYRAAMGVGTAGEFHQLPGSNAGPIARASHEAVAG